MGSTGVIVDSGNTSLPYVNQNSSDSFSGVMRISGSDIQYYSNGVWNNLATSYATVRLDTSTESLLQWCKTKQSEEFREKQARYDFERKAKTHPTLEKAYEAIVRAETKMCKEVNKAKEQFTMLEKIIGEEQEHAGLEVQQPMQSP